MFSSRVVSSGCLRGTAVLGGAVPSVVAVQRSSVDAKTVNPTGRLVHRGALNATVCSSSMCESIYAPAVINLSVCGGKNEKENLN